MAVTRRQSRASGRRPTPGNPRIGMRRHRWVKRYRPRDTSHRHRIKDRQPKSQQVSGYNRRI